MLEELNIRSLTDNLVQKGIISADAGSEVIRIGYTRAQIEACVREASKGGSPAFSSMCDILIELGYGCVVDAVRGQDVFASFTPGKNISSPTLS